MGPPAMTERLFGTLPNDCSVVNCHLFAARQGRQARGAWTSVERRDRRRAFVRPAPRRTRALRDLLAGLAQQVDQSLQRDGDRLAADLQPIALEAIDARLHGAAAHAPA